MCFSSTRFTMIMRNSSKLSTNMPMIGQGIQVMEPKVLKKKLWKSFHKATATWLLNLYPKTEALSHIVKNCMLYFLNFLTNHRHVCTHFDPLLSQNPNLVIKNNNFDIFFKLWTNCDGSSSALACRVETVNLLIRSTFRVRNRSDYECFSKKMLWIL